MPKSRALKGSSTYLSLFSQIFRFMLISVLNILNNTPSTDIENKEIAGDGNLKQIQKLLEMLGRSGSTPGKINRVNSYNQRPLTEVGIRENMLVLRWGEMDRTK